MAPNWNAANLANISHSHRYWFTGIGYKAGILGHIISDLRGGSDLRLLDIGSGPGWVPLELLLDPASPIANATALDRRLDYGAVGVTVARELELGADRFRFSDAGASGHSWEEPQDVVTALGSLLYLPREESTSVLDRAWDCLRSGGLLIVHENIRQDAFKGRSNDYDIMFTTEEIDALLGRFGPVRRFASSGPTEVARDKAGQRAVFRVVQKP